jgi:hypothetical protein
MELAQRERVRQRELHELATSGERDLRASPGRHCTWCPLLLNGCPGWKAIARKRWPQSKIQGDGPFVAIPRGEGTVCLFSTALERTTHAPPNSRFLTLHQP